MTSPLQPLALPMSQLHDSAQPFGETVARSPEQRLQLEPDFFDAMDVQTVEWAVQFDSLPQHLKARWQELVALNMTIGQRRAKEFAR